MRDSIVTERLVKIRGGIEEGLYDSYGQEAWESVHYGCSSIIGLISLIPVQIDMMLSASNNNATNS